MATHLIAEKEKIGFYTSANASTIAGNGRIEGLGLPSDPRDAASKRYVDDRISGIDPHEAVDYVSYMTTLPAAGTTALKFTDHADSASVAINSLVRVLLVNIGGTAGLSDSSNLTGVGSDHVANGVWEVKASGSNLVYRRPADWCGDVDSSITDGAFVQATPDGGVNYPNPTFSLYKYGARTTTAIVSGATSTTTVTLSSANTLIAAGMAVSGANLAADTTVSAIDGVTLTLSATPSAEIADSTLLTFTATSLDNGFGYYAGVVADSNAAKTYRFADGEVWYSDASITPTVNPPITSESTATHVSTDAAKVSKGAYLAVASGIADTVTGARGKGAAFILKAERTVPSSTQQFFIFRSSNLDFTQGVDDNSIEINGVTQQLRLKEGTASEHGLDTTDVSDQKSWSAGALPLYNYKALKDEDGVQPHHLHSDMVTFIEKKISGMIDQEDIVGATGEAMGTPLDATLGTTFVTGEMAARDKVTLGASITADTEKIIDTDGNAATRFSVTKAGTISANSISIVTASGGNPTDLLTYINNNIGTSGLSEGQNAVAYVDQEIENLRAGTTAYNFDQLEVVGNAKVGSLNVDVNAEVTGTLTVTSTTSLDNTLTVNDGSATTLGGTLLVKDAVTHNSTSALEGVVTFGSDYSATTTSTVASHTAGTRTVTLTAANADILVGMSVSGTNVTGNTKVSAIDGVTLTLDSDPDASAAITGTLTFGKGPLVILKNYDSSFSVTNAGHVSCVSQTLTSDVRLKENIAIESGEDCLEDLAKIDCLTYEMQGTTFRGVSAQAIQEVMPELVAQNGEYLAVNYAGLTAACVGAINELNAKIAAMQA